jgi:hypothetical protein
MTNLLNELGHFTGSETIYRHSIFRKFVYTEGVQYVAIQAGAYWLLDYIFSKQEFNAIRKEPFQVWIIEVQEDSSAIFKIEDGNKKEVVRFNIPFTNFPLKTLSLWLVNGTLLLPSEY